MIIYFSYLHICRNFRSLALTLRVVLSALPDNTTIEPKVLEIASLIKIIEAATSNMGNQINPSFCSQQYEFILPTDLNVNTTHLPAIDEKEFLAKYTDKTLRVYILLEIIRLFSN